MKKENKKNKKNKKSIWKRLVIWSVKLGFFAGLATVIFVSLVYIGLFGRIPTYSDLTSIKNQTASVVYSADNKMIGKYYMQNRLSIDNKNISPHVKQALIATEDSRFFEHEGLDYISLGRVIVKSLLLRDTRQGGGSTISQQLAKNLFPRTNLGFLTLPVGKIKEIFVASRLEKSYSKDEILALYLNTVPFGEDIYGIEVAANRFFNKSSKNLTIPEAATLVGMLAANTAYSPRLHPERSKQRRNVVLQRMTENNYITNEEAERLSSQPIELKYNRLDSKGGIAPYFLEKVKQEAVQILNKNYGDTYDIYTQGLKIFTTIDYDLQTYANDAVIQHLTYLQNIFNQHWSNSNPWDNHPTFLMDNIKQLERYKALSKKGYDENRIIDELKKPVNTMLYTMDGEKSVTISPIDSLKIALKTLQAGFVAINPENGHILAWNGGANYRQSQYDHVTASRQVGSVFKPFVYATALNRGHEPCEYFSNEEKTYSNNWTPANSDGEYGGYYSLKAGLIHSTNTTAAQLIDIVGVGQVTTMAKQLGIISNIPQVPSIALGTAEIPLLEMTAAYSSFPNYGRASRPVMILRIEDVKGKIIYESDESHPLIEAFNEETARYMAEILKEVTTRGTARSLKNTYGLKGDYGGKTGTTQNNSDGWFIGFTPNIVVGVWVGADSPLVRFRTTQLGQGAHTALPIFARFMQRVENSSKNKIYTSTKFTPLPDYLSYQYECEDFVEELISDDDLSFFERLFTPKDKPDNKERGKVIDKVKSIFRKRDDER